MFTKAIVKRPCKAITEGITSAPHLGKPNYDRALRQHDSYIATLEKCGVHVTILEADEQYPDSCFIEDTAVLMPGAAVVSNPGALARNGEKEAVARALQQFYKEKEIHAIHAPGLLDGGDIMLADGCFYIGLSDRTDLEGAAQLSAIVRRQGYDTLNVELFTMLHLKTGVNYLGDSTMLVTGEFVNNPIFDRYKKIIVPDEESYAANCLLVNEYVIVPEGFPKTLRAVQDAGFATLLTDTSEYRKLDGGLSCLSLRF